MVIRELTDEIGEDFDVPMTMTLAKLEAAGAVPMEGLSDYYALDGGVYAPFNSESQDTRVSTDPSSRLFYRRHLA